MIPPTIIDGKCRLLEGGIEVHCRWCCEHPEWRAERGFDLCPHGRTAANLHPPRPPGGPGTELKAILSAMGITPGNCACNAMAARMDAWGPAECEQHLLEIVATMAAAAASRGWMAVLPFKEMGARGLVLLAIRQARGKQGVQE